jgi:hypothetical protein
MIRSRVKRWIRDAVVLASFVPPVLLLLRWIYRVATWWVVRGLGNLPFVRSVLLSGSIALDDGVLGASDLDFIVFVDGGQDSLREKHALRASFRRWRRLFPMIGPVEERMHNVFRLDDFERDRYAAIVKCRLKTGRVRSVYGEPVFRPPAELTADEVLAEVVLQLKSVASKQLESEPNLYFWKSKIRALLPLFGRDTSWRDVLVLLDSSSGALLERLFTSSNQVLFFRKDDHADELAWNIVSRICRQLAVVHGFAQLPRVSIPFRSTPAPQCALADMPALVPGIVRHPLSREVGAFGGPALLNTAGHPSLLLELQTGALSDLASGLAIGKEHSRASNGEALLWWEDYVFQVAGVGCVAVLSRWDSPHLFVENFAAPGILNYPERFLELLLLERDRDLEVLKRFYSNYIQAQPVADHGIQRREESLRYFETRDRVIDGFATIHLLLALSEDALVNFGTVRQVLGDTAKAFPEHRETLQQLSTYADALVHSKLHPDTDDLPAGLLRAGIEFFGERLYGRGVWPTAPQPRQQTLSLCVCTRNRADQLSALLDSVADQPRLPDEVVIIDNGSTDHTRDIVHAFAEQVGSVPLRYVVDESKTIGKLRNRAIRESTGDIVCFTDDDCILHEGWFRNVEESFLLEDQIGAVGGLMYHYVENDDSLLDFFHQEYLGLRI